jgi:hypothetical protein
MYWNNPIIEYKWPGQPDPVIQSLHQGQHCLFFDPAVGIEQIRPLQTLQNLCEQANQRLRTVSAQRFVDNPDCWDWVSNIVKINIMVQSILQHGCVKPLLLHYQKDMPFVTLTGDSRLMAISCCSLIKTVPALITTHARHSDDFRHYRSVKNFEDFANVCQVSTDTPFLLRLTDRNADHGLDWFEYNNDLAQVPATEWCLKALSEYIKQQSPEFEFDTEWFKHPVNWK